MDNNSKMQKRARLMSTLADSLLFLLCELVAGGVVVGIFALLGKYDSGVLLGAIIGAVATVLNYFIMSLSINRAIDRFLEARGDREMDEEEAERFSAEHVVRIQATVKLSYIIRMVIMVAALVVALISGWFNPIATVIPLLLFKPVLYVIEFIRGKKEGK